MLLDLLQGTEATGKPYQQTGESDHGLLDSPQP
jgi:hypothetical protein